MCTSVVVPSHTWGPRFHSQNKNYLDSRWVGCLSNLFSTVLKDSTEKCESWQDSLNIWRLESCRHVLSCLQWSWGDSEWSCQGSMEIVFPCGFAPSKHTDLWVVGLLMQWDSKLEIPSEQHRNGLTIQNSASVTLPPRIVQHSLTSLPYSEKEKWTSFLGEKSAKESGHFCL